MPDQLNVPPIPPELSYIWDWWLELHKTRPVAMEEGHISYTEIYNWSTLLKINVTPFEIRCIMALDSAYIGFRAEQQQRKSSSKK
jgi:hypothetical protein